MEAVSSLYSALDDLAVADVESANPADLADEVLELLRIEEQVRAERLRRLAVVDQAGVLDGYGSTAAWLRQEGRLAAALAHREVKTARALRHMAKTAEAHRRGELTGGHLQALVTAAEDLPEAYRRTEDSLLDSARSVAPHELRAIIDYWRQNLDPVGAAEADLRRFERRRLYASATLDGMVRTDGWLDREGGGAYLTALDAATDPSHRAVDDHRTPAQRRADALVEICRFFLDHADVPQTGGERPHVTAVVDLPTLQGRPGERSEIEGSGVISPETARRIACDASVSRVITNGPSEVLDVGRRTRTVPAALRRALVERDGGCVATGCDRPPRWTDAHHLVHWADGGETSLDNLVLLCRRHHRLVHEGKVELRAPPRRGP